VTKHVPIEVLRANRDLNRKAIRRWIDNRKAPKRTPQQTKQLMEKLAKL
jgi:hypothetical protein